MPLYRQSPYAQMSAKLVVLTTPDEAHHFADRMRARRFRAAVDTETVGHDVTKQSAVGRARCVMVSVCFSADEAYAIRTYKENGAQVLRALKPWLEDDLCPKVGQNIKYDMHVCANHGIEMRGVKLDSMVGAWLCDENRLKALEVLVEDMFGEKYPSFGQSFQYRPTTKAKSRRMKRANRIRSLMEVIDPTSPLYQPLKLDKYAGKDAWLEYRVAEVVESALSHKQWHGNKSMLDYYNEIENRFLHVLYRMERRGLRVNVGYLEELSEEWGRGIEALAAEFARRLVLAGVPQKQVVDFNINSKQQLAAMLYGTLKLPSGRKTKKGKAVDKAEIGRLASAGHDVVVPLQQYGELKTLKQHVVELAELGKLTGLVHTSLNQTGTDTGRISSANPNTMNIPTRTEEGQRIRDGVEADEGEVILVGDYSQIELKLGAHFSGDKNMIEGFLSGADFHSATAVRMFAELKGVDVARVEEEHPDQRAKSKTLNFSVMYGVGPTRLAAQWGISKKQAFAILDRHKDAFPDLYALKRYTIMFARRNLHIRTLLRRYRHLPHILSADKEQSAYAERQAFNSKVQGSAADVIRLAMILLDEDNELQNLGMKMRLQVHDELVMTSPRNVAQQVKTRVAGIMENPYQAFGLKPLKVPTTVKVGVGMTYAEAK